MAQFLSQDEFERFRTLIYDASGIHFSESNRSILESRLRDILRKHDLTISAYYALLRSNPEELKLLLDSVTTNLTRFFRNTSHFQSFEYHVIPDLLKRKRSAGDTTFRLWSAGCSTGEEPYSFAMVVKELLPPGMKAEIIASDISLKSLMAGKEAFYPEARMNGVPEKYLARYFERKADGYLIKDEIRQMVRFDYHNLKFDSGLRNLDVVVCRNVIIYFDEPAQQAVIQRFWDTMNDYAYLFIGHSESLFGMKTRFEFVKTDWASVYRKNVHGVVP